MFWGPSIDPASLRLLQSWDLVVSFLVLSEEAHLAAAAQRLGVSRQTLARRIERLEELFGVAFLVRSSRRVELTRAGVALREGALPIADSMRRLVEEIRRDGTDGRLSVGIGTGLGAAWAEVVEAWVLEREGPAVLEHRPSDDALRLVAAGELDLLLYVGEHDDPANSLVVGHEPTVVLFPDTHPAARQSAIRTGDLLDLVVAVSEAVGVERQRETVERLQGDPDRPTVLAPRVGTAVPGLVIAARDRGAAAIVLADGIERYDTTGLAVLPMDPPLLLPVTLVRRPGLPDELFRGLGERLLRVPSA